MLLSQVRTSGVGFLTDYNDRLTNIKKNGRLTVALTRSRDTTIIFGNSTNYVDTEHSATETFHKLIKYCRQYNFINEYFC